MILTGSWLFRAAPDKTGLRLYRVEQMAQEHEHLLLIWILFC